MKYKPDERIEGLDAGFDLDSFGGGMNSTPNASTDHRALGLMRLRPIADFAASVCMIVAGLLVTSLTIKYLLSPASDTRAAPRVSRPLPKQPIDLTGVAVKGQATARVVLIQYSDFECPYCSRFARETLPVILHDYVDTGKLQVAFWHLPMEQLHPLALQAAQASECAADQGRFWSMHDVFFEDPRRLAEGLSQTGIIRAGLQPDQFASCLAQQDPGNIRARAAAARELQISATPTFLIGFKAGGQRVQAVYRIDGARPIADFRKVLDRATR
jgi:protein-disulfide isomerase